MLFILRKNPKCFHQILSTWKNFSTSEYRNTKLNKLKKIRFCQIKPHDYHKSVRVMNRYFFDDPLLTAFHVQNDIQAHRLFSCIWFPCLTTGFSYKVSLPKKKMAGIIINCEHDQEASVVGYTTISKLSTCEGLKNLFQAWARIAKEPNLGIDKGKHTFEICAVAVDREYRGLGIAEKLILHSISLAKNNNFNYARIDCTSPHTAKICERNNFKLIWKKPFKEFQGIDLSLCEDLYVQVFIKDLSESM